MVNELWPSRKKAEDNPLDDLMGRIESLVNGGQAAQLKTLVRDLGELILAVKEIIGKMEAQKLYRTKGGGFEKALEEMRGKVQAKGPPKGMGVVASMARWIQEH